MLWLRLVVCKTWFYLLMLNKWPLLDTIAMGNPVVLVFFKKKQRLCVFSQSRNNEYVVKGTSF